MKINTRRSQSRGFTLIEVTIALAITAVALVTLMGMIPQGLQTMREAADQAIEARIHQQILSELQLTPYSSKTGSSDDSPLNDFDGQERYYDSQGIELLDFQAGKFEHVYTARIHLPENSGGTMPESVGGESYNGVKLPGSDEPGTEFLRVVVVEITSLPYVDPFDWENENNQRHIHTYQTTLVKMGQDYTQ